ncbi:hypothetical protein CONPUDRAFT_169448 [Coniophora puteana RWD-64-598 SS2]|uniref:Cell wall protein n=1 Tax=Coniophora puteana (strain RWD-64-598) TaxID=741705 RepID=A0A5M3M9D6_CONPW|nr:uncharacterized protein CONPUDRAFT_169448 [Coniophora puteana RWD-64-598 SS2]EIW75697.1 hypothetical protein CONPUDRAFT_169448 [Coniophora puteana RWD-64-598 SS2]
MRSFITLAVLYATLAAAAPLPQSDSALLGTVEPVLEGLGARQLSGIIDELPLPAPPAAPPLTGLPGLGLRQLGKVAGAASGLEQKIDQTAASTGIKARQVPDPLDGVTTELDSVLDSLALRQLGGGTDPLDSVTAEVDSALDSLALRQLGGEGLGDPTEIVDGVIAALDGAARKRQAPTDAVLAESSELVDSVLGQRQAPVDGGLADVSEIVDGLLGGSGGGLRKRQDPLDGIDIDALLAKLPEDASL